MEESVLSHLKEVSKLTLVKSLQQQINKITNYNFISVMFDEGHK